MRNRISIAFVFVTTLLFSVNVLNAQTYNIADENGNSINTCGGAFTDSDAFNDEVYVNDEEYMVTFCADNAGECIQFDFTSFDIPDADDWLYIWDGADTATAAFVGQFNNPFGNNANDLLNIYPINYA